jgi:hypothetical protein
LRQSPWLDGVCDCEVYDLREAPCFFQLGVGPGAEHEPRRARVNVFASLKRFQHHGILRDMGQQTQFKLRIVGGDDLVSLFRNECAANSPAHLTANRNVLKVRIARG